MYLAHSDYASPMTFTPSGHQPVLLAQTLAVLAPERGGTFLDCTFGGGGHTRALLEASPNVTVVALDCDPAAAERAASLEAEYPGRLHFYGINFRKLDTTNHQPYAGVLMDLGVSSFQLDQRDRGFSFRGEADADMRMDTRSGPTAAAFLETAPEADLVRAIRDYGEEKSWRRVVNRILESRGTGLLARTDTLADLIASAVTRPRGKPARIHPATQSFQGIRIAVNRELETLEEALPLAMSTLAPEGILAVITFHSLEDRIVKRFFRRMAGRPEHAGDSRAQQDRLVQAALIQTRPMVAGDDEILHNPRSRSAKLRALRKKGEDPL